MADDKVDALVVSDPHNLAWAFNLRGGDVACTPLPLGYAIIPNEGRAQLFFDPVKITNEAGDAVGDLAEFAPISTFQTALDELGAKAGKVRVDTATGSVAILRRLEAAGGIVGRRRRSDRSDEGDQERRRNRGVARGASS